MPGQNVQDHPCRMDVVRQRLGTGGFHRIDPIGQHGAENVDHLPVATWLALQTALHTADRHRQVPFLERCAVAQGTRFAGENGYVMQGIEDGFAATEGTLVSANDLAILPAFQPIGIGADLDRAPDRTTLRTVFRDTRNSRQICLIDFFWMKYARLIFPVVSTINIPNSPPQSFEKASDPKYQGVTFGRRLPQYGGQFCMPVHKHGSVARIDGGHLDGPNLRRFLVDPYVYLAPDAAFGVTMLAGAPLTFTLGLDAGAVDKQV